MVACAGMQCVIVVFPDHTQSPFDLNSSKWISDGINYVRFMFKLYTCKFGPLSHLIDIPVFPCDNDLYKITVMHKPVFEHSNTL